MQLNRRFIFGLLALALTAVAAAQEKPAEKKSEPRTLKVKVNYTGSGQVDAKHPIFVFVFDTPVFSENAMPIGAGTTAAKDGTVTITDLSASPVYVVAAYDPQGAYDGQSGPPPSGSSMGVYSKNPPEPEPVKIEPGATVQIELPFDDSAKMP